MADNALTRKLGPLPVWQWVAIGGGTGLLLYIYEKNKKPAEETGPGLAASTPNPFGGGGAGGGGEGLGLGQPVAGPIGEPGPIGAPGPPGVSEIAPARIEAIESEIAALNSPPTAKKGTAPQKNPFPFTNPTNGQKYRTEKKNGKTIHVYANGHRVVLANHRSKTKAGHTAKPSHARPKKLAVKHAAAHKAPAKPTHPPATKKPAAKRRKK